MTSIITSCGSSKHNEAEDSIKNLEDDFTSVWEEKNFVDEFNTPTGEVFLQTQVEGTFSNSAATNEDLTVIISVDKDSTIFFKFAEYGNHLIKRTYLHGKIRGKKYPNGEFLDGIIGLSFDSNGVAILSPHEIGWGYMVSPEGYTDDKSLKFHFSDESTNGVPSTYTFMIHDMTIFDEAFGRLYIE